MVKKLSEYKDKIKNMCWSYSRLTSFGHCKYEFYLNYIINDDKLYLSEGNYYAEVGIFVHDILARIFNKFAQNKKSEQLSLEEASQYFVDNYDNNIFYKVKKSTMEKTFELCANYFADEDFKWLDNYEIIGVELESKFKIKGYDFIVYIDLLLKDKRDNKFVILDHKSSPYPLKLNGEVKKNSQQSFETYKKQMYLYSYAVKELYGEFPKEIKWNHFKDGGKIVSIPFKEEEYKNTIDWFINNIHKIEKESKFEPNLDYFYCTNLCNFRHCCEYCKATDWK